MMFHLELHTATFSCYCNRYATVHQMLAYHTRRSECVSVAPSATIISGTRQNRDPIETAPCETMERIAEVKSTLRALQ
ncbi:uncharacterized [Tachysurus ichikawai]